jgi:drug/metabolite transporter (DMT)-like permease
MISILFYLVFKEKLHREHFVGIFFLIFSVALIANAKDPQSLDPANATSQIEQSLLSAQVPIFVPMLLVLVNCSLYAVNSLTSRFSKFHGIPSLQFSADSSVSIVVITSTLFIH